MGKGGRGGRPGAKPAVRGQSRARRGAASNPVALGWRASHMGREEATGYSDSSTEEEPRDFRRERGAIWFVLKQRCDCCVVSLV